LRVIAARSLPHGRWRTVAAARSLPHGRWRTVVGARSLAHGRWRTNRQRFAAPTAEEARHAAIPICTNCGKSAHFAQFALAKGCASRGHNRSRKDAHPRGRSRSLSYARAGSAGTIATP